MKNHIVQKSLSAFRVVLISSVTIFGLYAVQAWVTPTASAPNGNVSGPITTSAVSQTKAGDIAVNGATHFLDTGTTIPETPAGGNGAVALNGWPNYSDVAANAVKLAGLTSADILSAQTAPSSGGTAQNTMVLYSGNATCPTGWTRAFTGKTGTFYPRITDAGPSTIIVDGINNATPISGTTAGPAGIVSCVDTTLSAGTTFAMGFDLFQVTNPVQSCAVCAR